MENDEPLFANNEPGPRFTVGEASERMRETGEDAATIATQLRSYLQRGLVQFRGKKGSGRTAHQLLAWSDILTARILRSLNAAGVADLDVLRAASDACYIGNDAYTHPATTVVTTGHDRNEAWIFRLEVLLNTQTGARSVKAFLYEGDKGHVRTADGIVSLATITVPAFMFVPAIRRDTKGAN